MIRFNNDYKHGAHPVVLDALERTSGADWPGADPCALPYLLMALGAGGA